MGFWDRIKKPNWSGGVQWLKAKAGAAKNAVSTGLARFKKAPPEPPREPSVEPVAPEARELPPVEEIPTQPEAGFASRLKENLSQLPDTVKARVSRARAWLKQNFPRNLEDLKKLQTDEALDRLRRLASGKAYGMYLRMGAATIAAYFLADTVSLFTDSLVPDPPPVPAPRVARKEEKRRNVSEYDAVIARNIFNSQGLIPEEGGGEPTGPARKSNLPLNLIGTVVLKNELKSIATIEDKSQNMVFPLRVDDTLGDKIRVTKIEHLKVFFINKSTGHLEYIEIVEDMPQLDTKPVTTSAAPKRTTGDGVAQNDETHYEINRNAIDKSVANLSEVLQQARAIPNFENGMPDGYKILQIVPGSIFDQLGIKNGDVVMGLNGEPINDPGKAFQLFNDLRSQSHVEIGVKRSGRKMTMNYDIR
jgi:general secretion pathway protein C